MPDLISLPAVLTRRLWPVFEDPAEEARFREQQSAEFSRRVTAHAPMAVVFAATAAVGHVLLFPRHIWLPILGLLTAMAVMPLLYVWWLARHETPPAQLQRATLATAVIASTGVCLVVASARAQGYPLPYEGILLVIMAIFLLSGLLAREATLVALTCVVGIVVIEWMWPTSLQDAVVHSFFGLASWLLGSVFSRSIERADRRDFRHRELLHATALRDPLTGLLNRRGLDERFAVLVASARREGSPLSLAIIDLDHFKSYNDTYGHEAGDAVLVAVSNTLLQRARRPLDITARLGGEEFLLAWHDAGSTDALRLASDTCAGIHALALTHRTAPATGRVTASIGIATAHPVREDDSLDSLCRAADAALYAAKRDGRNRVCVSAPHTAS